MIFEYQLARWLKAGDWDDQPFNAGAHRAEEPNAAVQKKQLGMMLAWWMQGLVNVPFKHHQLLGIHLEQICEGDVKQIPKKAHLPIPVMSDSLEDHPTDHFSGDRFTGFSHL